MIFEILCLLLKVTRCDVGPAEVISARAITGVHAGCSIKFGVIEAGRHSCALLCFITKVRHHQSFTRDVF